MYILLITSDNFSDYPVANIAPESSCKSSTSADTLECTATKDNQPATYWAPEIAYVGEWMEITLNQVCVFLQVGKKISNLVIDYHLLINKFNCLLPFN